jgi:hypothetical protein|tara:strand:+ start:279 stop:932 length:654 start_codon:yes stop_codon:yes gene_type:complete
MATLNEIVYNIAEQVNKADDTVLLNRLRFMVGYYRAQFIRQDQRRNHSIPSQFIQKLDCLEMEAANAMECCTTTDIGCTVWRTKKEIPKPVRVYDGSEFAYVGTVDGKKPYQRTTGVQAEFASYNRYTPAHPRYIYANNRLYVLNATPSSILVKGIFEQPEELEGFVCCDSTSKVFTADTEYPMSMDMVQRVTQSILATEMRLESPVDDSNEVQLSE